MIETREKKVTSTVHLNRSQVVHLDRMAKQTGQSRAYILREVVEAGLLALGIQEKDKGSSEKRRRIALERLLRMGEGYGASRRSSMKTLDIELYEDA